MVVELAGIRGAIRAFIEIAEQLREPQVGALAPLDRLQIAFLGGLGAPGELATRYRDVLPFTLTAAQEAVIAELSPA